MTDFADYDDDQLEELRLAAVNEQERRDRVRQAPGQAAQLAIRMKADGGDVAELITAIESVPPAAPE